MLIPFQQGIVQYGTLNGIQQFLVLNGTNITLNVTSVPVIVTLSQLDANYLINETVSVPNAWSVTSVNTPSWLYWDINTVTGKRTFGVTYVEPVIAPIAPSNPSDTQMWFNTSNNTMNVFSASANQWSIVIRAFAAQLLDGQFYSVSIGLPNLPYAGTQAGLNNQITAGEIVFDENGAAVLRSNKTFFTTVTAFFTEDNVITSGSLQTNKLIITATQNIPAGYIVAILPNNNARLASYNDIGNEILAISNEVILQGNVGQVTLNGIISNQEWSWENSNTGNPLWINGSGELVTTNPHVLNALNYMQNAVPIGAIYDNNTIIFNPPSVGSNTVITQSTQSSNQTTNLPYSSISQLGGVYLTLNPVETQIPIAVGTNDPRMTNARVPLPHSQPASGIIVNPVGTYIPEVTNLQTLASSLALTTGFTLTGDLILGSTGTITIPNAPTNPTDAVNQEYVENLVSESLRKSPLVQTISPNTSTLIGIVPVTSISVTYKFIITVLDMVTNNAQACEMLVLVNNYTTCYNTIYGIIGNSIPYTITIQSNEQGMSIIVYSTNANNIQFTAQQVG